ncbi:TetR/AcrR family transcriptional regulator [Lentilactobacillus hilgardii]|nr:TetR/AcrR family transcriptional regulator [Lentilactobacillus hilgardii]EEI20272.1 transcriptional regulator, TetR family [Lentilactobacillus buchneri ATCC 11577]MCT3396885.1 TetR/AcrR family transcriptional regulator [Lentilactobacillus hilgardii]QIR08756.1 hypothetical protein G8J22_00690 [Lentilactobacillus hilgardii]
MTVDIRIKKTKRNIFQTFLKLITQIPFQKITVYQIYTEAEIAKSTFYDHFDDKYDLLEQVIQLVSEEFNSEVERKFAELNQKNFLESLTNIFLNLSKNHNELRALLKIHETPITLESELKQKLVETCRKYLNQQRISNQFSIDFLSHFYGQLSVASITFALDHYDNQDWMAQQLQLMNDMQQNLLFKVLPG